MPISRFTLTLYAAGAVKRFYSAFLRRAEAIGVTPLADDVAVPRPMTSVVSRDSIRWPR